MTAGRPGILLALWLAPCAGCAQREPVQGPPQILAVTMPEGLALAPGGTVSAEVRVRVDDAYHVMANPASESYLVPLRLELDAAEGVVAGKPSYPEAVPFAIDGIPKPLATYEGTITLTLSLSAAADAAPGRRTLAGRLHFQGCSRHTCLIPTSMPVELHLEIES